MSAPAAAPERDSLHRLLRSGEEQLFEPRRIHRLVETIGDRLADKRVVRDFACSHQVFGAGDLIGKDPRQQILGIHAKERRRDLFTAAETRQ